MKQQHQRAASGEWKAVSVCRRPLGTEDDLLTFWLCVDVTDTDEAKLGPTGSTTAWWDQGVCNLSDGMLLPPFTVKFHVFLQHSPEALSAMLVNPPPLWAVIESQWRCCISFPGGFKHIPESFPPSIWLALPLVKLRIMCLLWESETHTASKQPLQHNSSMPTKIRHLS